MEEWLIYLIGTLIVVDMIIFVAWAVLHFAGARLGYRWRKLLWLVLSVRLLIPVRMILNGKIDVRTVGYGTSIFTGKKAAKMRIRNMFVKKNKWGYIVLGVLTLCAAAGSSMWVLSGQSMENVSILDSPRSDVRGEQSEVLSRTSSAVYAPPSDVEGEPDQDVVRASNIVIVEDMQDISRAKDLNYYTTDIIRAGNHYWIDEQNTLWGTGYSEYGQLGELREDLSQIREPVKIAENVKHVDFSGEYFVIYITGDGQLYGLGGNPAGILRKSTKDELNSTYMNVVTEPVLLMENVLYAKCGYSSIILLTEDREAYVLGNKDYVSFTNNTFHEPEKVMENVQYVTSFLNSYAVIDNDDNLWTWGDNRLGQCGAGTFSDQIQAPRKVMEHVQCAWMGSVSFNSAQQVQARARDNLIVLTTNGEFYGCGEGIGTEKYISGINDMDAEQEVAASETFQKIVIQEFIPLSVSLKDVELLWSEETLKQFLDDNAIDYTVGNTDEGNYLLYSANKNTWEFLFDDQGQLAVIESTKCDEMGKDMLQEGDTFEKVIECYGTDYEQYDLGWGYFIMAYEGEDYDFQIGIYSDDGCARFSKFRKGFRL